MDGLLSVSWPLASHIHLGLKHNYTINVDLRLTMRSLYPPARGARELSSRGSWSLAGAVFSKENMGVPFELMSVVRFTLIDHSRSLGFMMGISCTTYSRAGHSISITAFVGLGSAFTVILYLRTSVRSELRSVMYITKSFTGFLNE